MRCKAVTSKGTQCKRNTTKGSTTCSQHRGGLWLASFLSEANDRLESIVKLRTQYCIQGLSKVHQDEIKEYETELAMYLEKAAGGSVDDVKKLSTKFNDTYTKLVNLVVKHCKVEKKNIKLPSLPDIKVSLDFTSKNDAKYACNEIDIPAHLREWFEDEKDEVWSNKQVLCTVRFQDSLANLPSGLLLQDNYQVVVSDGHWYGVAKKKKKEIDQEDGDGFARRLISLLKTSTKLAGALVKATIMALWRMLQWIASGMLLITKTTLDILLRYWKQIIAVVVIVGLCVHVYPWLVTIMPTQLLGDCTDIITESVALLQQRVPNPPADIAAATKIAEVVVETCENTVRTWDQMVGHDTVSTAAQQVALETTHTSALGYQKLLSMVGGSAGVGVVLAKHWNSLVDLSSSVTTSMSMVMALTSLLASRRSIPR